jgi:hypothetical protein
MIEDLEKYTDDELNEFMAMRRNSRKIPIIKRQIELCRRVLYTIEEIEKLNGGNKETVQQLNLYKSALSYCKAINNHFKEMEKAAAYWGQENETSN